MTHPTEAGGRIASVAEELEAAKETSSRFWVR